MTEPSKDELVKEAENLGVDTAGLTKPQLQEAIEERQPPNPPELGPVVPPGSEQPPFESVGSTTGVQPQTPEEIPEAGR